MKTMKRLLALLLALAMVMPNCLTIASAYSEEFTEELVEEIVETPEEVVEEVFEEEVSEEETPEDAEEFHAWDELTSEEIQEETVTWEEFHYVPDMELPSDEELFRGYVDSVLYPEQSISLLGTMGLDSLDYGSGAYVVYTNAYDMLLALAEGRRTDAQITIGDAADADVWAEFPAGFTQTDMDLLLEALLADLPYHMYWFDKLEGVSAGFDGSTVRLFFSVAQDYADQSVLTEYDEETSLYCTTDPDKTGAAEAAAQYAREVANLPTADVPNMSVDYQVMEYYYQWIRDQVTYNWEAAGQYDYYSTVDSDPWQLIYVFDQDENTNVVCEGYAKAFQYLCDQGYMMSVDTVCCSVTGDLYQNGVNLGGHMWNLVTIDGGTYLVDVTNGVFLESAASVETVERTDERGTAQVLRYTVYTDGLSYEYDVATTELFGNSRLQLSAEPYDPMYEAEEPSVESAEPAPDGTTMTQAEFETALAENDGYRLTATVRIESDMTISEDLWVYRGGRIVVGSGATLTLDSYLCLQGGGLVLDGGNLVVNNELWVYYLGDSDTCLDVREGTVTFGRNGYVTRELSDSNFVEGTIPYANYRLSASIHDQETFLEALQVDHSEYSDFSIYLSCDATLSGEWTIDEHINVQAGYSLTLQGDVTNNCEIAIFDASLVVGEGYTLTNNGTVNCNGGSVTGSIMGNAVEYDDGNDGPAGTDYTEESLQEALNAGERNVMLRNDVTITGTLTIPEDVTLAVQAGYTVTVAEVAELVNDGTISLANGSVTVEGSLENNGLLLMGPYAENSTLEITGSFVNNGNLNLRNGTVVCTGTYTGDGDVQMDIRVENQEIPVTSYMARVDSEAELREAVEVLAEKTGYSSVLINSDISLTENLTIPKNVNLEVGFSFNSNLPNPQYGLTIPQGVTLTNNNYIYVADFTYLYLYGTLNNNGTVYVNGTYVEEGQVTGNPVELDNGQSPEEEVQDHVWMRINGRNFNYDPYEGQWYDDNGPVQISELGLSYDYDSNTLTMSGAGLSGLEVGYYGWDENGRTDEWQDLPSQNLTIVLEGENSIISDTDSALKIYRGAKVEITGDGSLYLETDNGEGFYGEDENSSWWYSCPTVDIGNEESELTISGDAKVTVKLAGKGVWSDENGNKQNGYVSAIQGYGRALTINDNAALTTLLPEDAVRYDGINEGCSYSGIDVQHITVNGGKLNTQSLNIGEGFFTQRGGVVNITALGGLSMADQWQWDEEAQEDVIVGQVEHTHYDALNVTGGTVTVTGGMLNINIPGDATTPSTRYRGIVLDSGVLNIGGDAVVTIDPPTGMYGRGIELLCARDDQGNQIEGTKAVFNMDGGSLNMHEELFGDFEMTDFLWTDDTAELNINGGEWSLDAVFVEINGTTHWNGGVVNGEEVIFQAGGPEFVIHDGEINLWGRAPEGMNGLFRASGMVTMEGGTMNITNGVLGVRTAFNLAGGEVNINNDETWADSWGVYVGNYLSVTGGTLNVHVPGGESADGGPGKSPAMQVEGIFHQMGGTVNLTSDTTAAIRSFGSVLLNDGQMNLSGTYGIGQLHNMDNPEGQFEVSGGRLNIEASDTGIYAEHSYVRFVPRRDEGGNVLSDPDVTITATPPEGMKAAAIQLVTGNPDFSGLEIEGGYTFRNEDGAELAMEVAEYFDDEGNPYYAHTLMDGEGYALCANMKPQVGVDSDEALAELPERTGRSILITGDVTLSKTLILEGTGSLTVAEGATLTIPAGCDLVAEGGTVIRVEAGGKIVNYGKLVSNMGDIRVVNADGYVHNEGAEVVWHHDNGMHGTIENVPTKYWYVNAIAGDAEQIEAINTMADTLIYGAVTIQFFNPVTLTGPILENPYEIRVSRNAPWYVYTEMTLDPGIQLTIENGAQLHLWDTHFQANGILQNNGTLNLHGGYPDVKSSSITVASSGILSNSGEILTEGAVISVQGRMLNSKALFLNDGAILTVDGQLINYDAIHVAFPNENDVEDTAQLNINGSSYSYGYLNNCAGGTVNISGLLNVESIELGSSTKTGFFENHGTVNVSGSMNIGAAGMNQSGTVLVNGVMNVYSDVENNGFIGLQTNEQGGGSLDVTSGGRLLMVYGGTLHVNDGAVLTNNGGDVRIRMGTLYVTEDGSIEGNWDGTITRQYGEGHESTEPYLAVNWLNDEDGQVYAEPENGLDRGLRILPGDEHPMVFYANVWNDEELHWDRWQVIPAFSEAGNLSYESIDSEESDSFIRIKAGEAWGTDDKLTYTDGDLELEFWVTVGVDKTHGFYSSAEGGNGAWLESVDVDNLSGNPGDEVFYYILTAEGWELTGEYWLDGVPEHIAVNTELLNDNVIRLTIPADSVAAMEEDFWLNMNVKVQPTEGGDEEQWGYGINVSCTALHEIPAEDAWMRLDGMDLNYSAEYGLWLTWGEEGREIVDLSSFGLTYDYDSNTLTMENAKLSDLEVGYYGWDDENQCLNYDWTDMPGQELTINLVGQNFITSTTNSALRANREAQVNITSSSGGTLYIKTDNGEGFQDDNGNWYSHAAVSIEGDNSALTLSGDAQVTVAIDGKAPYTGENGEIRYSSNHAVCGSDSLTVKDDAVLTTVLPEDAVRNDNLNGGTSYYGIGGFATINIEGGTVNTQYVNTDNYTQTDGTVNITAIGDLSMNDQYEWNDETGENEYKGQAPHTHYDGLYTNGGNVSITGGALNITIPGEATTDSVYYRGIAMDSGELTIGGTAVITVDGPANIYGDGIALSCGYDENGPIPGSFTTFRMTGGKFVMNEALFDSYDMAHALKGDGNAVVEISGGEWDLDAVYVELHGQTTWNGGTFNGEEVIFIAGGEKFIINDGEFNLRGAAIEGDDEIYSNALFQARGQVTMNGGVMNITNGILAVPTSFALDGGEVTVNNSDLDDAVGVGIGNYLAITGGTLNVHVPGGQWTDPETNETTVYPAVWVEGCLHQMGGTVNITSDTTAAIRSYGSVLLNNGQMNLSGLYGIGQLYSENNPDGEFFVNGGQLNIEASDTGIFAGDSNVVIRQGENGVNPAITINAAGAAIQMLSEGEESGFVSDYAFVNAQGEYLTMNTLDGTEMEQYQCYVHTLMDGDGYATYAQLHQAPSMSQDEFVAAMQAAAASDDKAVVLNGPVIIESDVTLESTVIVRDGGTLMVKGGTLTIPNQWDLAAEFGGTIIADGGYIRNEGMLAANAGSIDIRTENGYAHVQVEGVNRQTEMHNWYYPGTGVSYVSGIDRSIQSLRANVETAEQLQSINGVEDLAAYGSVVVELLSDMTLDMFYTIPANVSVNMGGGKTLTVSENVTLTIEGSLFVHDGAVLMTCGTVNNNGSLHIGMWQDGTHEFSGTMAVEAGGVANLRGYTCIHGLQEVDGEMPDYYPGNLQVYGTVNTYAELPEGSNGTGTGGYIQNGGILNIHNGGVINSGFLFSADSETNVFNGGTLNHSHEMLVTGMLNVAGELNNTGVITVENGNQNAMIHVDGKLVNDGQLNIVDSVIVRGELENNAGIFMMSDAASFVAEGGTVTNNFCISTEATRATIDFTNGTYIHGSMALDGVLYPAELDSDYFADGTTSNVRLSDMSKVTLRYAVTDLGQIDDFRAKAKTYGSYILAFAEDTEIPETMTITVDENGYLTVKPGMTLTNHGMIVNQGKMYLGQDIEGNGTSLINNGFIINEASFIVTESSSLENYGTLELGVNADTDLRGNVMYGQILVNLDENGQAGNIHDLPWYCLTGYTAIPATSADPVAHIRNVMAQAGSYSSLEIHLLAEASVTDTLEIPGSVRLYIGSKNSDKTGSLTIAENAQMVVSGLLQLNMGELNIDGRFVAAGTLDAAGGTVTVNGELIGGGVGSNMIFQSGASLVNNGIIDNGDTSLDFQSGAVYTHGQGASLLTSYMVYSGEADVNRIEGIPVGYQTLFHPVREFYTAHDANTIVAAMEAAVSGGYAGSEIRIFNAPVAFTENTTIPENAVIYVGKEDTNAYLAVSAGAELTVDGIVIVEDGNYAFINNGTTVVNGRLENHGTVTNNGQMDIYGTMKSDDTVYNETTTHVREGGVLSCTGEWVGYAPINMGGTITGSAFAFNQSKLEEALKEAAANGYPFVLTESFTLERELTVEGTLVIGEGCVLTVPEGVELNVTGTLDIQGALDVDGTVVGDGLFQGVCGDNLTWKLSGNTLIISGTGAMTSAPWNVLADRMAQVTTIKLSTQLTSIVDEAFASCGQAGSILIPRSVVAIGSNAIADGVEVKIYHNSAAEELSNEKVYIHEIDPETGDCRVEGCPYNIPNIYDAVKDADTVEEKVDVITGIDADVLKEQIQAEVSAGETGEGSVSGAIKDAEAESGVKVEAKADSDAITEDQAEQISIEGAALSASEDADTVTLVVTDTAKEDVPEVDQKTNEEFTEEYAVAFDLTLEGVDDPENLTVPVTVTMPIPEDLWDFMKTLVILHHAFSGLEEITPMIDFTNHTVTFVVSSFSTFEFRTKTAAYLNDPENTYASLAGAIAAAESGDTITLKQDYKGEEIVIDKALTIVKNGCEANVKAGAGFKLVDEGEQYVITALKLFNIAGTNVAVQESLDVYFYVNKADLVGQDYYAEVTKTYADSADVVVRIPYEDWQVYSKTMFRFACEGIYAFEMTDDIRVTIYHADGTPASNEKVDSVQKYTLRLLNSSNDEQLKTVLVDMLNYGAATQEYFGYNQENLAANGDEIFQKYATKEVSYQDYREKGTNYVGTTLTAGDTLEMTLYFRNITSDMTADLTYTDVYGDEINMSVPGSDFTKRGDMIGVAVPAMPIYDGRQLVTCEVKDANGEVVAKVVDSIESYVARMSETSEVFDQIMKFVESARVYFSD